MVTEPYVQLCVVVSLGMMVVNVWSLPYLRVYVKADKDEIDRRYMGDFELHRALKTVKRSFVAVEFGTVDNLGHNQFRYMSFSTSCTPIYLNFEMDIYILARITRNAIVHRIYLKRVVRSMAMIIFTHTCTKGCYED